MMNHSDTLNQSAADQYNTVQSQLLNEPTQSQVIEDLTSFESKIHKAKLMGEEWVETTPDIIQFFNRSGLGKNPAGDEIKHFLYKGIKVCATGTMDAAIARENEQSGRKIHGPNEGIVVTGQAHLTK